VSVQQEGDPVNIDLGGIIKEGVCADAATSVSVGQISDADKDLPTWQRKRRTAGIEKVRAGVKVGTIARAIEETAWHRKYVVNVTFTGNILAARCTKSHQLPRP